ncbi:MAG: hypothetical protein AAF589_05425 [Planctomycetota bacterium]
MTDGGGSGQSSVSMMGQDLRPAVLPQFGPSVLQYWRRGFSRQQYPKARRLLESGMLRELLRQWADWTGDELLTRAIRRELRQQKLAVHAAKIRDVRLVAIERPGWVQVRRFRVETTDGDRLPIVLQGLARDDGRKQGIDVLLTTSSAELKARLDAWSEGLIRRR